MSEYMWAKIKIGNSISRPVLTYLAEVASLGIVYHLEREDDEAAEGRFEELKVYLVEQAIPFDRWSDGKYEYSPELRTYRPRLTNDYGSIVQPKVDRTFLCDHDNDPAVLIIDISKAIAETGTREEFVARLIELCGLDMPALPPLSVVEVIG